MRSWFDGRQPVKVGPAADVYVPVGRKQVVGPSPHRDAVEKQVDEEPALDPRARRARHGPRNVHLLAHAQLRRASAPVARRDHQRRVPALRRVRGQVCRCGDRGRRCRTWGRRGARSGSRSRSWGMGGGRRGRWAWRGYAGGGGRSGGRECGRGRTWEGVLVSRLAAGGQGDRCNRRAQRGRGPASHVLSIYAPESSTHTYRIPDCRVPRVTASLCPRVVWCPQRNSNPCFRLERPTS